MMDHQHQHQQHQHQQQQLLSLDAQPKAPSSNNNGRLQAPNLDDSIIIFNDRIIPPLESSTVRLPPNYVGVRNVRVQSLTSTSTAAATATKKRKNVVTSMSARSDGTSSSGDGDCGQGRGRFQRDDEHGKNNDDDKFVIRDSDGNEIRRMTKGEKRIEKMKRRQRQQQQMLCEKHHRERQQQVGEGVIGNDDDEKDKDGGKDQADDDEDDDDDDDDDENHQDDDQDDYAQHEMPPAADNSEVRVGYVGNEARNNNNNSSSSSSSNNNRSQIESNSTKKQYHQLPVDTKKIEEELAESRLDVLGEDGDSHADGNANNHHYGTHHTNNHDNDDKSSSSNPTAQQDRSSSAPTSSGPAVRRRLPVVLSPPMSLQAMMLQMKNGSAGLSRFSVSASSNQDGGSTSSNGISADIHKEISEDLPAANMYADQATGTSTLSYDHILSGYWSDVLKTQCIEIAEKIRSQEDMRPLAYRLHPEPWQRLRIPNNKKTKTETFAADMVMPDEHSSVEHLHNVRVPTSTRVETGQHEQDNESTTTATTASTFIPESCDWTCTTCRPSSTFVARSRSPYPLSSSSSSSAVHHDVMLSLLVEYIYTQTPYFMSCGAKFGCDLLIYDGPRHERHAFAGLKVLSSATTFDHVFFTETNPSQQQSSAESEEPTSLESMEMDDKSPASSNPATLQVSLPLPTAYSLTSFVRCLNTAGKLALIATVVKSSVDDGHGHSHNQAKSITKKTNLNANYRILFVDVALEKVLDAPTHKRKQYHNKRKKKNSSSSTNTRSIDDQEVPLQKRKDMSKNLEKHYDR